MTDRLETEETARRADLMLEDDGAWGFYDADPSVAWGVADSLHGRLGAMLEDAGWERCYHRDRAQWHFNVKVGGSGRGFNDAIDETGRDFEHRDLETIAEYLAEGDLYIWWEDISYQLGLWASLDGDLGRAESFEPSEVWQCGRMGGYLNLGNVKVWAVPNMIRYAPYLETARAWFRSAEYGRDLAERAIVDYDERRLAELASPRPERIEA